MASPVLYFVQWNMFLSGSRGSSEASPVWTMNCAGRSEAWISRRSQRMDGGEEEEEEDEDIRGGGKGEFAGRFALQRLQRLSVCAHGDFMLYEKTAKDGKRCMFYSLCFMSEGFEG